MAQDRRELQVASNALKQKEAATNYKIEANHQSKKRPFNSGNGKGNKGWKNKKSNGKREEHASSHEPSHKYHKGNNKGKGKGKNSFTNKW